MNKIQDADFMTKFPLALKKDETMAALGQIIAEELHITADETKKNIIYANIENLSEKWLDVLAYDLHVDWYDYDYPIDVKRAIIKDSVRVHQKLGTKYAVETALRNVYKDAKVFEWFEYGGKPYYFKIDIDTGGDALLGDAYADILSKVQFYKNLRSHCDGIYISLNGGKAIISTAASECIGAVLKIKAKTADKIESKGIIRIITAGAIGATLKVKPALIRQVQARGKENTIVKISEANSFKIKARIQEELRSTVIVKTAVYQKAENNLIVKGRI